MTIFLSALLLSVCFGLVLALIAIKKQQNIQVAKIQDLQHQLSALCTSAVGVDKKILNFERSLKELQQHHSHLSDSVSPQNSYDHAIRLARQGVDPRQLVANCNLSDEEAALIARMHGEQESFDHKDFH